jgi:hypothetical protein
MMMLPTMCVQPNTTCSILVYSSIRTVKGTFKFHKRKLGESIADDVHTLFGGRSSGGGGCHGRKL